MSFLLGHQHLLAEGSIHLQAYHKTSVWEGGGHTWRVPLVGRSYFFRRSLSERSFSIAISSLGGTTSLGFFCGRLPPDSPAAPHGCSGGSALPLSKHLRVSPSSHHYDHKPQALEYGVQGWVLNEPTLRIKTKTHMRCPNSVGKWVDTSLILLSLPACIEGTRSSMHLLVCTETWSS